MKKIILWIVSVFLVFLSLGAFTAGLVPGACVLGSGVLCNPSFLSFLGKKGWKPKKIILIPAVLLLFFLGVLSTPGASDSAEFGMESIPGYVETEVDIKEPISSDSSQKEPSKEYVDVNLSVESSTVADAGLESTPVPDSALDTMESVSTQPNEPGVPSDSAGESLLYVHYIDVGQGDATLLSCNGEYMLIDAGDDNSGTLVQNYLRKQGVEVLKYVVGTHADADHYGGLDVILYKYDCETIFLTNVKKDTAACRNVFDTMENKRYKPTEPVAGAVYSLGDASVTILGPLREYDDINDSSIALMVTHGDNSFLFTGDCEAEAESDLLLSGASLKADVYKAGHHGSSTSSDESFLDAVAPAYCVISCGEQNDYGHPHAQTLNNLRARNVSVYRTDEQGSIIAVSDKESISFNCAPSDTWKAGENVVFESVQDTFQSENSTLLDNESAEQNKTISTEDAEGVSYVVNTNTNKFHYPSCSSVKKMKDKNRMDVTSTREELISQKYSPCGNCKP